MSVISRLQNRQSRVVLIYPTEKRLKNQIYTRRTHQEVLSLFDGLVLAHKEVARLESYIDGEWVLQETKKLQPKKQLGVTNAL